MDGSFADRGRNQSKLQSLRSNNGLGNHLFVLLNFFFPDWKQHLPDGSSLSTKLGWTDSGALTAKNHPWGAEQDQVDLKSQVIPGTCFSYPKITSYSPGNSMLVR